MPWSHAVSLYICQFCLKQYDQIVAQVISLQLLCTIASTSSASTFVQAEIIASIWRHNCWLMYDVDYSIKCVQIPWNPWPWWHFLHMLHAQSYLEHPKTYKALENINTCRFKQNHCLSCMIIGFLSCVDVFLFVPFSLFKLVFMCANGLMQSASHKFITIILVQQSVVDLQYLFVKSCGCNLVEAFDWSTVGLNK